MLSFLPSFFPIVLLLSVITATDFGMAKDLGLSNVTGPYLDLEDFPFPPMPAHHHTIETSFLRLRLDSSILLRVIGITAEELQMG